MESAEIVFLAIDDNRDNLVVLKALLREAFPGSRIALAESGRQGLAMCMAEKPDVILLDLIMPEMDGFEVCTLLKQDPNLRTIPVIILTAVRADKASRIRALESGADAFLSKPIDDAELSAQVKAMLRIKRFEDSSRDEADRLSLLVLERTIDLERELSERRKVEDELRQALDKMERLRKASLNLMEDLKAEIEVRKHTEEEIRQLNITLEKRVDERTSELTAANKELEAFTYTVSHDLRAPLRAVEGFTRILQESYHPLLDEAGVKLCSTIMDAAQQAKKLIDELLNFSRFGRKEIHLSPVSMTDLVRDSFREITSDSPTSIEFHVTELPTVLGDTLLLKQCWSNLLSNAVKYSARVDHPVITIWSEDTEEEIVFHVLDNGAGFDMRYADKLFGVFQRLHSAEEYEGTGVGLAIVQRIIHRHGGRVWGKGEVGVGAEFCFTLPVENRKGMEISAETKVGDLPLR